MSSPQDYQVIQRHSETEGTLHVQGKSTLDAQQWQYRLLATADSLIWQNFPTPPKDGTFDFTIQAPAGGWFTLEIRARNAQKIMGETYVAHVGIGEVFIIAGQSNAANYGSEKQTTQTKNVASFNGTTWTLANDPQPGAAGSNGSFIPAFGDAMSKRFNIPIGVACIAEGGTSVREWLPKGTRMQQQPTTGANVTQVAPGEWESTGYLYSRLEGHLKHLGPKGFRAILWHQGESDAGQARAGYPADRQITGEQYVAFMKTLIHASQNHGDTPIIWFTAQTTYHSEEDASDPEFRAAMQQLWEENISLQGPDTDTLRLKYRDGVHFNPKGLQAHGELWATKVGDWREKTQTP